MADKLRVGIIGQGRSGYNIHMNGLRGMTDKYEIVAVADPMEGRCDDAVNQLGATGYKDYREMLARTDLDLIVNAIAQPSSRSRKPGDHGRGA